MRFWKYQGLGNDFIIVRMDPARVDPDAVVRICDRHLGVGADGVLAVSPDADATARMTVFNADGSRPEMCGNGVRCVARFLMDVDPSVGHSFTLQTDAGPLSVARAGDDIAVVVDAPSVVGEHPVRLGDVTIAGARVDAGNPHLVVFDPPASVDHARVGAALQAEIPGGVNVSFATVDGPHQVQLVVYERGCGLTLACGTAAYSTAKAGWTRGRLDPSRPTRIRLPGGSLQIEDRGGQVLMTGPAERSFVGERVGRLDGAAVISS